MRNRFIDTVTRGPGGSRDLGRFTALRLIVSNGLQKLSTSAVSAKAFTRPMAGHSKTADGKTQTAKTATAISSQPGLQGQPRDPGSEQELQTCSCRSLCRDQRQPAGISRSITTTTSWYGVLIRHRRNFDERPFGGGAGGR